MLVCWWSQVLTSTSAALIDDLVFSMGAIRMYEQATQHIDELKRVSSEY